MVSIRWPPSSSPAPPNPSKAKSKRSKDERARTRPIWLATILLVVLRGIVGRFGRSGFSSMCSLLLNRSAGSRSGYSLGLNRPSERMAGVVPTRSMLATDMLSLSRSLCASPEYRPSSRLVRPLPSSLIILLSTVISTSSTISSSSSLPLLASASRTKLASVSALLSVKILAIRPDS